MTVRLDDSNPMRPDQSPRVTVVYATMFGATEEVAESVSRALAAELGVAVPCRDAGWLDFAELEDHDLIVIGSCTWNIGQLPSDWEARLQELAALDLTGKLVALFGTGDARGYPDTYLDALDAIAKAATAAGATLLGEWSTAGYRFTGSLALRGDSFVGLALDQDNDHDLTEARIGVWCAQLAIEAARALGWPEAARALGRPEPALAPG